jgi:putative transposase
VGTGTFEQGRQIEIHGKSYHLMRLVSDDLWQLEEVRTKRIIEKTITELKQHYVDGQLRFQEDGDVLPKAEVKLSGTAHQEYPKEAWDLAKLRRAYVIAVIDLPSTKKAVQPVITALWKKMNQAAKAPSPTSVLRWKRRYTAASSDIRALMDNSAKKGNRNRRYPKEVEQFVDTAIRTTYLTRERKSIQDTIHKAQALVIAENKLRPASLALPLPTRRFVQHRLKEIPAFDQCAARHGREAAVRRFRSVLGYYVTKAPLERAETDHSKLDMLAIDDATGLPLGRPWLTVCIDDYTRIILGFELGFEPPSYLTVAKCLKNAFLPKTNLRTEYSDIDNDWEAYGLMQVLVVDNGAEFHSESLENACLALSIEIHYAPRRTPWFKGKVERFCGTFNNDVSHGIPGTTFSNIFDKDDYDPAKHAVVRWSVLKKIVKKWIADVYHQRPHRTLQAPPAEVWRTSIVQEDIRVPSDPAELDAILGRCDARTLTHKGIELDSLFYNSHEMTDLRHRYGEKLKVELRIDDSDLGHIIVLSPDKKRRYKVPALEFGYAKGLTRWQHRVCKRFAAEQLARYDSTAWIEAKDAIAKMISDEVLHKTTNSHARMARFNKQRDDLRPNAVDEGPVFIAPDANANFEDVDLISDEPNVGSHQDSKKFAEEPVYVKEPLDYPMFTPRYRNLISDESQESNRENN